MPQGRLVGRIDGLAKVTGAKLYASDFRAADLPGWPPDTAHALLVRAPDATHLYQGLDLGLLRGGAAPAAVVTATDMARTSIKVPAFYAGDLFCPVGNTPLYLGQPVALLVFDAFDAFDQARLAIRDGEFLRFGADTGPVPMANYGAWRFTRVAGPSPDSPDIYSPLDEGWVSPGYFESSGRPIWKPLPVAGGAPYAKGAAYGEQIRAALAADDPAVLTLSRDFTTQSVDPMFLEPECGLAWFDAASRKLELVLGVQSPFEAASAIADLLGEAADGFKPAEIKAHFAYVGGGFGGRDHTPFPLYVALAALFLPGRPVRLAHDRYQQFQGGIKRHAFKIDSRIGVERASGRITAFAADHVLDGGGLANYSGSVAVVAATGAIGIYDVPKVDITTVALHSRGITAGSMRGYGSLQTMTALETLVDEVAAALPLDPIEFRRRNALKTGGRTMTGNPYTVSVRTPEILDKLEKHPIWQRPADAKAAGPRGLSDRHRHRLHDQGLRDRRRLLARHGRDRSRRAASRSTPIASRWATASPPLSPTGWRFILAVLPTIPVASRSMSFDDEARRSGRLDSHPELAEPRSAPSHLQPPVPCSTGAQRHGGRARDPVRLGRLDWAHAAMARGRFWRNAQARPASWHGRLAGAAIARRLQPKGMAADRVTGAMTHAFSRWAWSQAHASRCRRGMDGGYRRPCHSHGDGTFSSARSPRASSFHRPINRHRHRLSPRWRHAGAHRDRACDRGAAYRQGVQRVRMRRRRWCREVVRRAGSGWLRHGRRLCPARDPAAVRRWSRQWTNGISAHYLIARGSDLPLHDLEIEVLPPLPPTRHRRAWRRW